MERSRELTQVKTDTENAHGSGGQETGNRRRSLQGGDSR